MRKEYRDDPVRFWRRIPFGDSEMTSLNAVGVRKIGLEGWDKRLEDRVLKKHAPWWGVEYFNCSLLAGGWESAVVARHLPDRMGLTTTSGLFESVGGVFAWQEGMMEVEGYYLFNKETGLLVDLLEVDWGSEGRVRTFLLDDRYREVPEQLHRLKDRGEEYDALVIFNPRCG